MGAPDGALAGTGGIDEGGITARGDGRVGRESGDREAEDGEGLAGGVAALDAVDAALVKDALRSPGGDFADTGRKEEGGFGAMGDGRVGGQ